jgi:hypothetical protein
MTPTLEHRITCIQRLQEAMAEVKTFGYDELEAECLMGIHGHLQAMDVKEPQQIKYRDALPMQAATIWRRVAQTRRKLNQLKAAAAAHDKVEALLRVCTVPLPESLREAMDKAPAQAGLAWHEQAEAALTKGDKADAAACMLKAAERFAASPLPLKDWQTEVKERAPSRAGLAYHELAKAAEAAGEVEQRAAYLLDCAKAYRASPVPLKDWAEELRDKNPPRAAALYLELAKAAEKTGDLARAASLLMKTADAYAIATVPLAAWQIDQRDNNPARAAFLHHKLADEAKIKGDKASQALHLVASAECFARSSVPLKPWQVEARDGNHLKAAKLMAALAEERQKVARGEELADVYVKAASFCKAVTTSGSDHHMNAYCAMKLNAASLYRQVNRYKVDYLFAKEVSCYADCFIFDVS